MQLSSSELVTVEPVRALMGGYFRQRRLFTIILAIVLVIVAALTLLPEKKYLSETKFLLENNRSNSIITSDRSAAPSVAQITEQEINSELEVLASEDVIGAVADPSWKTLSQTQRTPAALKIHGTKISDFRRHLKIDLPRKSNIITVSYTASSSSKATEVLEKFSSAYLTHRKLLSRPMGTSRFFVEEAQRYQEAWQKASGQLVEFQQQHQVTSVPEEEQALSKAIASDQDDLRDNQAALSEMNGRLLASSNASAKLPQRQQTESRVTVGQAASEQIRALLTQLQNKKTELLTRYIPTDRLVTEVDRQIADTTSSLNASLSQKGIEDTTAINPEWQQVQSSILDGEIERHALQAKSAALALNIANLHAELSQLEALEVPFNVLEERADQARGNFEIYSEKKDQAQIEDAMDDRKFVNVAVAESPTSTYKPVSPQPLFNTVVGLLSAVFLAGGGVYFAESSRSTVATAMELESFSRFPVLATVPSNRTLSAKDRDRKDSRVIVAAVRTPPTSVGSAAPAMQNYRNPTEA